MRQVGRFLSICALLGWTGLVLYSIGSTAPGPQASHAAMSGFGFAVMIALVVWAIVSIPLILLINGLRPSKIQQRITQLGKGTQPPVRKVTVGGVVGGVVLLLILVPFAVGLLGLTYQKPSASKSATITTPMNPKDRSALRPVADTPSPPPESKCKIDNWRYRGDSIGNIVIEGTSTCATGMITIRAHDSKGNYLGNGDSYIQAYAFTVYIRDAAAPKEMKINYVI